MNEIMNAQKITGLKNTALKESLLTIRGAVLSVNASQWEVAQAVHDILVKETFKEDFETEEKFADFIGISRSNCNKMKKAVDFRNSNETFKGWTLNKIYEIMCLPKEEAPKVLKDYMIDKDDTVKEIREAVKAYKDDTSESKIVADVEPEEKEEEKEEEEEGIDIEAKPEITFDDFMKMQFQVGEIIACEEVKKSRKLLCSQVRIGSEVKQIVSGIKAHYSAEEMVGKKVMVLVNLKPAKLAGVLSEGMLLCAEDADGNLALMTPEKPMPAGAEIC